MSYRLKFDEPPTKSWRRIVGEQIESATALLRSGKDVDAAIHETRKSMKRARALLKLFRPGLSAADYKREKKRFGDIGRILSGDRDRAVMSATAAALAEQTTGKARVAAKALVSELETPALAPVVIMPDVVPDGREASGLAKALVLDEVLQQKAQRVRVAIAALEEAGKSLKKLKVKSRSMGVVHAGLEQSYRNARRDMMVAYRTGVDERFHEWRKSVQAHWRHMLLVDRAWPDVFAARAQLAKEMSDLLGEDHDLYVLIGTVDSRTQQGAEGAGYDALVRAARVRQEEIRAELEAKGEALFAETTRSFLKRVDAYWRAARTARKIAGQKAGSGRQSTLAGKSVVRAGIGASQGNGAEQKKRAKSTTPNEAASKNTTVSKPQLKSARTPAVADNTAKASPRARSTAAAKHPAIKRTAVKTPRPNGPAGKPKRAKGRAGKG